MKISRQKDENNPAYLGYDEDNDGEWDDYFQCQNQECNEGYRYNYITTEMYLCPVCGTNIEWIS